MKIRSPLCLVVLTSFGFGAFHLSTRVLGAQQLVKHRTIARLPIERDEPVRIRAVRVKGAKVLHRQRFVADDDWLSGLSVTIKNRSEKAIIFGAIDLQFPRPLGSEGRIAIHTLEWGNRALLTRKAGVDEHPSRIAPGQTVILMFSPRQIKAIGFLLTATGYPLGVEKLVLRVGNIIFEDDTMWYAGTSLQRDRNDPVTWVNAEESVAKSEAREQSPGRNTMGYDKSDGLLPIGLTWNASSSITKLSGIRSLFSPASYIARPPTTCNALGPRSYPGCNVYRWCGAECRISKDTVTTAAGNFYLLPASGFCQSLNCITGATEDCTVTSDTLVANTCSGGGGGGGGGGGSEGGTACWSNFDCDFGYSCGGFGFCESDGYDPYEDAH